MYSNPSHLIILILCILLNGLQDPEKPECLIIEFDKKAALELVNQYRAQGDSCGRFPTKVTHSLTWNDTLAQAALNHCFDMCQNNFYGHMGSDSLYPTHRIWNLGYNYSECGENIVLSCNSFEEALESWRRSEAHCLSYMNPKFTEVGIANGGKYWTMVLAKPRKRRW